MKKTLLSLLIVLTISSLGFTYESETDTTFFNIVKSEKIGIDDVILTSGVFLITSSPKEISESSLDELKYKDFFTAPGTGTAFLYDGYILTNYHICRANEYVYVRDFKKETFKLKVLEYNIKQDVCVIEGIKKHKYTDFKFFKSEADPLIEEKNNFLKEIYKKQGKVYVPPPYVKIHSIFGTSTLTKLENDTNDDAWSTVKNSTQALGKKCKSGISGSPVSSTLGFEGMGWAAENPNSKHALERNLSLGQKNSTYYCFFMSKSEIENIVEKVKNRNIANIK